MVQFCYFGNDNRILSSLASEGKMDIDCNMIGPFFQVLVSCLHK